MAFPYNGIGEQNGVSKEEDQRLTLAFENLDHLPPSINPTFTRSITTLDLSHNRFSELSFLRQFPQLASLIIDHNLISSATTFPCLPTLKILWLNHNRVDKLFPFVQELRAAFPNLEYLSLMANEAVPLNIDDSTFYQHLQYRLFVISWFPALEHLDDQPVTPAERAEAERLYKRPLLERLVSREPVSKVIKTIGAALGLVSKQTTSGTFKSVFV